MTLEVQRLCPDEHVSSTHAKASCPIGSYAPGGGELEARLLLKVQRTLSRQHKEVWELLCKDPSDERKISKIEVQQDP